MIDTLKSSFHTISKEELLERLEMDIYIEEENEVENEESEFYNWCSENINLKENGILKLNDVCELFIGKKVGPRIMSRYKKELEKFIKENYPNIDHIYKQFWSNDQKYNGWQNLEIS